MRQPIKILLRNFGGMLILPHFSANLWNFQIFLEQSIFAVQKRLIYEKAFIFDEKCDAIKVKQFAQVLSDIIKTSVFLI